MDNDTRPAGLGPSGKWSPTSFHVVRSICNPLGAEDPVPIRSFTITLDNPYRIEGYHPLALVGEIQSTNSSESHFVAVTALLLLEVEEALPDLNNEEQYRLFLERASKWGSHLLWDYVAAQMRTTANGLLDPELNLPTMTPAPTLLKRGGREPIEPDSA